ncbi:MAG: hypothetical protein KBD53_09915 [Candidatus Omnitrophica bacterium]|nr:hypothetical protein [Candidatus Omnitrophota bacterium]
MIRVELLHKLLNTKESDLKEIDTEQLRTMLGAFRYFVRLMERELNIRSANQPLGSTPVV